MTTNTRATWVAFSWLALATAASCTPDQPTEKVPTPTKPQMIIDGGTERPEKLIVGFTPFLPEETLRKDFTPLMDYIGRRAGIPAELRFATSYAELAELLAKYEVHVAVFSPLNYVRAKRSIPDLVLLATHIADGSSTYSAYIIAREDSTINTVEELRGKRFGFVDRNSTSGYLYPLAYLRNLGFEPDTFFGAVEFAGNHELLIEKVQKKELDAGATFSTAYKLAADRRLRIVAKTGRIPFDAYCASPRLARDLVESIRTSLLPGRSVA